MAIVAPRLYYNLSPSSAGLSYPSLDSPPPPSSTKRSHARIADRASPSSTMPSSLNPAASSSFYPIANSFHPPQPHPSYYPSTAIQNREKLREELAQDSTRLTSLIRRLETQNHEQFGHQTAGGSGSVSSEADILWLEAYKILFMIRTSLRRPSSSATAVDDAIHHWANHIYLFQRLAHLKQSQDNISSSAVSPYSAQRNFDADIPSTVCRLASVLSDFFSQKFNGRLVTPSRSREITR